MICEFCHKDVKDMSVHLTKNEMCRKKRGFYCEDCDAVFAHPDEMKSHPQVCSGVIPLEEGGYHLSENKFREYEAMLLYIHLFHKDDYDEFLGVQSNEEEVKVSSVHDLFGEFIDEMVVYSPGLNIRPDDELYKTFSRWMSTNYPGHPEFTRSEVTAFFHTHPLVYKGCLQDRIFDDKYKPEKKIGYLPNPDSPEKDTHLSRTVDEYLIDGTSPLEYTEFSEWFFDRYPQRPIPSRGDFQSYLIDKKLSRNSKISCEL